MPWGLMFRVLLFVLALAVGVFIRHKAAKACERRTGEAYLEAMMWLWYRESIWGAPAWVWGLVWFVPSAVAFVSLVSALSSR